MNAVLLDQAEGHRTWALVFDKGDEVMGTLQAFAEAEALSGSHLTAIGAFERCTLGYFDRARRDYRRILVEEQVEVLSLVGDVARKGSNVKVHAHAVVGRIDGSTRGGHVLEAFVWPTLEVVLREEPAHLRRVHDEETGLALIDAAASSGRRS